MKHLIAYRTGALALLFWWVAVAAALAQLPSFLPLKVNPETDQQLESVVADAVRYTLNGDELLALYQQNAEDIRVTIPGPEGQKWILHLTQSRVLTDDFRLTDQTGQELPYAKGRYYRGNLFGRPECWVAASFFRDHLMAVIVTPEGTYNLGPQGGATDRSGRYVLFNESKLKVAPPHSECQVEEPPTVFNKPADPNHTMTDICRVVTKLFVCDYQMYLDFGRSTQGVMDYVTGMYNVVAMVYDREQVMTQIAQIGVYTEMDPFQEIQSTYELLKAFSDTDPLNNIQGVDAGISLAHLLSSYRGRWENGWFYGRAYRDVLCRGTETKLQVAFTEISTSFSELPFYSWTINGVAHMLGLNIGSYQTQSCLWPGGPIDGCAEVNDGNCTRPDFPSPPFKGTIMSHCNQVPGIGIDLNLGFGPLPGARIRNLVRNAYCLKEDVCDCFAPRVPMATVDSSGTKVTVSWMGSPRAQSFVVEYRITGDVTWIVVEGIIEQETILTGLKPNRTYEIRVRAICDQIGGRNPSLWSRIFVVTNQLLPHCTETNVQTFSGQIDITDGSGNLNYRDKTLCTWEYTSQGGFPVQISFLEFRTEAGYDSVNVYDGSPDGGSELLGSFSGTNLPATLLANSGTVYIEFTTDVNTNDNGWRVRLNEVQNPTQACQGQQTLSDPSGTFTDGSGPSNYGPNADCSWLIQPTGAQRVRLNFRDFNTEAGFDRVRIYDGNSSAAALLGDYSGQTLPPVIETTGPRAFVSFITDGSLQLSGWTIDFQGLSPGIVNYCKGRTLRTAATDTITDGSGTNNYGPNSSCEWLIQPPNAVRIEVFVDYLDSEASTDSLSLIDNTMSRSYSGSFPVGITESFVSNSSAVLVRFESDRDTEQQGFRIRYVATIDLNTAYCKGEQTRTAAEDTITDGSGPALSPNNADCRWLIQPPNASRIILSLDELNIERDRDFLRIYDGPDANAPLLGTFTSTIGNRLLVTTTGSAYVVYSTDTANRSAGWSLAYTSEFPADPVFCQGQVTRTAATDTITDGSGNRNYGNNSACYWLIQPANATNIRIVFDSLRVDAGFDFVSIYDGPTNAAPLLGRYTGSTLPQSLLTSGGTALVEFTSDFERTATGWGLTYEGIEQTEPVYCSGQTTLTALTGVITDGSGPENYGPNSNCRWLIQPAGNILQIVINFDSLNTEPNADVITIYAGTSIQSPVLGRYSGNTLPNSLLINAPVALVVFQSNGLTQESGWGLRYEAVSAGTAQFCRGTQTLTAATGTVTDGSGPRTYGPNSSCRWLIQPARSESIDIDFTAFNIEPFFDNLYVYDGATETAPLLGRFSGDTLLPKVTATSGTALVVFTTDRSDQRAGWSFDYTTRQTPIPQFCRGLQTRTAPADTVTDGSGPNVYLANADCRWLIAPEGAGALFIDFLSLDTERGFDFVQVFAGPNVQSPLVGRYSGDSLPGTLAIRGGFATLLFTTNGSAQMGGWSLRYRAEFPQCRGLQTRTALTDTITDGSGSVNYGPNSDCRWLIQPTRAQNVVLEFLSFATQNDTDFVSIYAGRSMAAPLLGRFSGTNLPPMLNSRSSEVLLVFTSDAFKHAAGWNLVYTAEYARCSSLKMRTLVSDTITDGSGAANYGPNSDCRWLVNVRGATSLEFVFNDFATRNDQDVLRIYDGSNANAPLLGTFFGSDLPATFSTTSGQAYLVFSTDLTEQGAGWRTRYTAKFPPSFCRGQMTRTALTDTITDGSGAANYGPNADCRWLIQPASAIGLNLTFEAFATQNDSDRVRIYAGNSTAAPLVGTFSGTALPDTLTLESATALVVFTSNIDVHAAGWQLRYTAILPPPPTCEGVQTRTAASDTVTDGSGELSYTPNLDCSWLLTPEGAQTIVINFLTFDTEAGGDVLRVYAGNSEQAPLVGSYSGGLVPPSLVVESPEALLVFMTDDLTQFNGWSLRYSPSPNARSLNSLSDAISVYPNPTNGAVTVDLTTTPEQPLFATLTDLLGRTVLDEQKLALARNAVHLDHLPAGVYMMHIRSATGAEHIIKIVKE